MSPTRTHAPACHPALVRSSAVLLLALGPVAWAQVPPVPVPPGNPITAEKAVLGKILFWDEQLSSDDTVACGTCHQSEFGGADPRGGVEPGLDGVFGTADDVFGSFGVPAMDATGAPLFDPVFGAGPQVTARSTPTIFGSLWAPRQFWDGRAGPSFVDPVTGATVLTNRASLEAQAVGPIVNDVEMAHQARDWAQVTAKLATVVPLELARDLPADVAAALAQRPSYGELFAAAFGDPAITAARIGMAIATYERTLVPDQTPWDRFQAGDPTAMTPRQVRGFNAFQATTCDVCHTPPLFTNDTFRNVGLRPLAEDHGRMDVTGDPADDGRFKVPSLRNVGLKTQFMHTGHLTTLTEVMEFYLRLNGQVQFPANQDPAVRAIAIPPPAFPEVVDFLTNALTDPRVANATFPFDKPTLHADVDACRDGLDNDGDGLFDLADPGCASASDSAETAWDVRCDDGRDNDHDGLVDSADPDCDAMCIGDPSTGDTDGDGTCDDLDLLLSVGVVHPGEAVTLSVVGARPGSRVAFLVSLAGQGVGPCLPSAGICADLLQPMLVGQQVAGPDGTASVRVTVPSALPTGREIAFQAAWIDPAAGEGETSDVAVRLAQP